MNKQIVINQQSISKLRSNDEDNLRLNLLSDFLFFAQFFFKIKSNKDFIISKCTSNTPHAIIFAREFQDVFLLKTNRLAINCPPGWHKSEFLKMFVAWTTAHYPDSNHLYISYSERLATKHTGMIRDIMSLPIYGALFNVKLKKGSTARDLFMTEAGGVIGAFGSAGAITGCDSGLPGLERYSGATLIDDILKPKDAHSDLVRIGANENYEETIEQRLRGINVPTIAIGQRLHEDDFFNHIFNNGQNWKKVILTWYDEHNNNRYPEIKTDEALNLIRERQPYVWASQYMQNPMPAGGALFKDHYFKLSDFDPAPLATFISCDTAETTKSWNDKSVFSFWSIYPYEIKGTAIPDQYSLHWLDCVETQVEPADLEDTFMAFWEECMRYQVKPSHIVIEDKSTGVTLSSVLEKNKFKGIIKVKPTLSKSQRYIDIQQYLASHRVTLPEHGRHTKMCVDQMCRITANETHRWDDIADTCQMAVKAALMDKLIIRKIQTVDYDSVAKNMMGHQNKIDHLRNNSFSNFRRI